MGKRKPVFLDGVVVINPKPCIICGKKYGEISGMVSKVNKRARRINPKLAIVYFVCSRCASQDRNFDQAANEKIMQQQNNPKRKYDFIKHKKYGAING